MVRHILLVLSHASLIFALASQCVPTSAAALLCPRCLHRTALRESLALIPCLTLFIHRAFSCLHAYYGWLRRTPRLPVVRYERFFSYSAVCVAVNAAGHLHCTEAVACIVDAYAAAYLPLPASPRPVFLQCLVLKTQPLVVVVTPPCTLSG
jgi:hypothetical protein